MNFEGVEPHEGWLGAFTRAQAPGAMPNGTRVVKAIYREGDSIPVGSGGTVLGSIHELGRYFYFVEFDDGPRIAVGVLGAKIRAA